MTFWNTATREEKLAQIDGGIECGMTARQVAMCLGAPEKYDGIAVRSFARMNGRSFNTQMHRKKVVAGKANGEIGGIVRARNTGLPDYEISSAFSLFDRHESSERFLDEVDA